MAELIDMNILVGRLTASHTAHAINSREESLLNRDLRIVLDMPTTTEAEIMAKAIDEFAEKLKDNIFPMSHGLGVHDIDRITEEMKNSCIRKTFHEVDTDYIAEQLKEE